MTGPPGRLLGGELPTNRKWVVHPSYKWINPTPIGSMYAIYGDMDPINIPYMDPMDYPQCQVQLPFDSGLLGALGDHQRWPTGAKRRAAGAPAAGAVLHDGAAVAVADGRAGGWVKGCRSGGFPWKTWENLGQLLVCDRSWLINKDSPTGYS